MRPVQARGQECTAMVPGPRLADEATPVLVASTASRRPTRPSALTVWCRCGCSTGAPSLRASVLVYVRQMSHSLMTIGMIQFPMTGIAGVGQAPGCAEPSRSLHRGVGRQSGRTVVAAAADGVEARHGENAPIIGKHHRSAVAMLTVRSHHGSSPHRRCLRDSRVPDRIKGLARRRLRLKSHLLDVEHDSGAFADGLRPRPRLPGVRRHADAAARCA